MTHNELVIAEGTVTPDPVAPFEREEKGEAIKIAAKKAGVGAETVRNVKKILEQADDELKENVKANKVSTDKAFIAFKDCKSR